MSDTFLSRAVVVMVQVRLVVSDPLHVSLWGLYAPSEVTGEITPSAHGLVAPASMKIQVRQAQIGLKIRGCLGPSHLHVPSSMDHVEEACSDAWPGADRSRSPTPRPPPARRSRCRPRARMRTGTASARPSAGRT